MSNTRNQAINDYLIAVRAEEVRQEAAQKEIAKLFRKAAKQKMPTNIRPATARDCARVGNVIWHPDFDKDAPRWNIVDEPLHYGDDFKAYVSDGCRYGLHNAFVETP